jgi:hypothetical protein
MATTRIQVTAVDNELYLIAVNTASNGSSEICHLKGNSPPNLSIDPKVVLPPGSYTLVMVGINWGGPQAFQVILTTDGVDRPFTAPTSGPVGANWTQAVPITVV